LGIGYLSLLRRHYAGENRRRLGFPGELEVLELFAGAHWSRRTGMGSWPFPPGVSRAEKIGFLAQQPDRTLVAGMGGGRRRRREGEGEFSRAKVAGGG